jgi:hypothetical protein
MVMRDADNGKLLWSSRRWTPQDMLDDIMEGELYTALIIIFIFFIFIYSSAKIPKEVLECDAVSREINFTSREEIQSFRLEQRIFVHGTCLEGEALLPIFIL